MLKNNPQFILLNAGKAEHNADWNWENVNSPFARLFKAIDGHAKIHTPNKIIDITPGHIYFIPPFTLHRYECSGRYSHYYFHIYENLSNDIRIMEEYLFPFEIDSDQHKDYMIKRLFEINPQIELAHYDPSSYDNTPTLQKYLRRTAQTPLGTLMETNGIISQLLSAFLEPAIQKYHIEDDRIQKSICYIREHIDEDISLDLLAAQCFLSKDHFIRLFHAKTGQTPLKYINTKKIEKAQLLLISTNISVKDIAYRLSFNNMSNFNRLFKKFTLMTPEQYRNEM